MRMYRNPELRRFLVLLIILGAAATAGCYFFSRAAVYIAGAASIGFIALLLLYTFKRYRQIDRLSLYLARINRGDDSLDVRDNKEGELSILKSEIYKVTVTLKEQNELLRSDKTAMADALSDISHQLKTPLTSMFMMTDLILDASLTEEDRRTFTQRIRMQLERLQWLVTSLLKLSKLDAGTARMEPAPVTAKKLLDRSLEPLRIPMELKDQRLNLSGDDITIWCNEAWTAEALLNILKNCVEYTPVQGEVTVAFSQNPLFTQLRITDTGPGIDPNDLPHIFKRFYRGKHASDDSVGIGLAMAAAIVEGQGGAVEAKSHPDKGGEFVLRFPRQPQHR
jgi:signal transduction histidine kinase